jgi:hypothetical protein
LITLFSVLLGVPALQPAIAIKMASAAGMWGNFIIFSFLKFQAILMAELPWGETGPAPGTHINVI